MGESSFVQGVMRPRPRGRRVALFLRPEASRAHKSDRLLQRAGGGAAFADDVERRAVRGGREHRPQSARHGDAAIEALELRGDLSLVVIHRQHAVVVAGKGLEEYGIRRKRARGTGCRARPPARPRAR